MSLCQLSINDEGVWLLEGELSFSTVTHLEKEAKKNQSIDPGKWCIDLTKVDRIDSAGLALLLEWYALAKRKNIMYTITSMSNQAKALLMAQGLGEMLT